jgi:ribosomal protein S18 acetylase RimI-like enzyme
VSERMMSLAKSSELADISSNTTLLMISFIVVLFALSFFIYCILNYKKLANKPFNKNLFDIPQRHKRNDMSISFDSITTTHIKNLDLDNPCFDTVTFELFGNHKDTPEFKQILGELSAKSIKASDAINFSRALLDEFLEFDGSNVAKICEAANFNHLLDDGANIVIIRTLVVDPDLRRLGVGSKLLNHAVDFFHKRMENPYIAISAAPINDSKRNTFPAQFASFDTETLEKSDARFDELLKGNKAFLLKRGFNHVSNNVFERLIEKGESL